ncbi:MAG: VIT and VWA domain-containing protein [Desulfomonilaceae bacterium]|jgi:Ca-activated chloride channel family protein
MTGSRIHPSLINWLMGAVLCLGVIVGPCLGDSFGHGRLTIIDPDGKTESTCPLEHTSVKADVSGFVASVEVKQVFHNPRSDKIEAIYTFPLSADGAVDQMLMKVGDKVIRGEIKRREEARQIYETARDKGQVASLLDQERPNIFTQSVANIMPGEKVEITIRYVETLNYEDGAFKFNFPMVVGPRFIPGQPDAKQGTGWARDTSQVPDASRITPPVAEEGKRAGHEIDLAVSIDAGVRIEKIESQLHEVDIERKGESKVLVSLRNKKEIPNRDFVLSYLVASDQIKSGVLAHKDGEDGYVMMVVIPPKRVSREQTAPREMIFIIDVSGSQQGLPLEKAKETVNYIIDRMNPNDTFNVIDFNDTTRMLFPSPKENTPETRAKALQYVKSLKGSGGTRMISAIWEALNTKPAENRLRVVTFMTDGLVGNDFEVISMVKKLRDKSRWFSFGTGNSVNKFLLDNVARVGGGDADYILLNSPEEAVAKKFYERISTPVLTEITMSCEGSFLQDVYPGNVSDLWSHRPLIFKARYTKSGKGTVKIKGFHAGKPYEQDVSLTLPENEAKNSSISSLWARSKIDELVDQDLMGIQRGNPDKTVKEEIVKVALVHRIMTQFTSFVAVEDAVVSVNGKPVTVTVPVELPQGVSREGVFGPGSKAKMNESRANVYPTPMTTGRSGHGGSRPGFGTVGSPARKVDQNKQVSSMPIESKNQAPKSSKLSEELVALVSMKDKPLDYSSGKVVVKDGKLTVQVWLSRSSEEIIRMLEEKGLKITFQASTGKMVIGSISVENLPDLEKITEVRLIEPFSVTG